MMWLRASSFTLAVSLAAASVYAGQPTTSTGPDVVVEDATGPTGGSVTVGIRFVPAPDDGAQGGPDEIAVLQLALSFAGLVFNQDDPTAVVFNPGGDSVLAASFSPPTVDGSDDPMLIVISDPRRAAVLPAATLLQLKFQIPPQTAPGQLHLTLSSVTLRDRENAVQPVDEAIDGVITVTQQLTPTATRTPTRATPTPTPSPTRVPTTPRATPTQNPPTPGPGTPPPGIDLTVTSSNGGCAIGDPSTTSTALLLIVPLLFHFRRRMP